MAKRIRNGLAFISLEFLGGIVAGGLLAMLPMTPMTYIILSVVLAMIVAHMGWRIAGMISKSWPAKAFGAFAVTAILMVVLVWGYGVRFAHAATPTPLNGLTPSGSVNQPNSGGGPQQNCTGAAPCTQYNYPPPPQPKPKPQTQSSTTINAAPCSVNSIGGTGNTLTADCRTTLVEQPANESVLVPANDPMPKFDCPEIPKDALLVNLGSNILWMVAPNFSKSLLMLDGVPIIAVNYGPSVLNISILRLYENLPDGRLNTIASIHSDRIWTDPSVRAEKPDSSTLQVFDRLDNEALNIRFSNRNLITVTGTFRGPLGSLVVAAPDELKWNGGSTFERGCMEGGQEAAIAFRRVQPHQPTSNP